MAHQNISVPKLNFLGENTLELSANISNFYSEVNNFPSFHSNYGHFQEYFEYRRTRLSSLHPVTPSPKGRLDFHNRYSQNVFDI